MYSLPENVDLSFFHNKKLLQVCIGANEVILRFDGDISILIQTDIVHKHKSVTLAVYKLSPASAAILAGLIHCDVVNTKIDAPSTLELQFSNDESLEMSDTSSQFESYIIEYQGKRIIV